MSLQVEKLEKNMAKLTIEVSAEDFEKALQSAYNKQKGKIALPGFRKGKAPRNMVEKMYGPEVFYEDAANELIPEAYEKEMKDTDLLIVSRPEVDIVQMKKGEPFIFTAEVALKPEVTLGAYKGMEVEKLSAEVSDEEVDAKLKEEADKNARTITVEGRAVEDGDEIILDYEGFADGVPFEGGKGENQSLVIGSGTFIPGFEEQLIGVEPEQEVEVNVTFPEEYHAEELKGKEAVFKCTVHEIKAKEVPEIDDEFAAEVSEFDTLDEYKADVKKQLAEEKEKENKKKKEDAAVELAVANAEMDIPEAMVKEQARQMLNEFAQNMQYQGINMELYCQITGSSVEQLQEEMIPQAKKRIETRLVLEAVAKAENIEISDEQLQEEIEKMAKAYDMEPEKLNDLMGEAEKEQMKEDMAVQEAVTLITDAAVEK